MLVLSRKTNEVICIGDNIEVQVLQIKGGIVRLGISAPREVSVIRSEIIGRASKRESEASANAGASSGFSLSKNNSCGESIEAPLARWFERRLSCATSVRCADPQAVSS